MGSDDFGVTALEKKIAKHTPILKDLETRKALAGKIRNIIGVSREAGVMSRQEVIRRLDENNISVIFRENDEGRIYGATFIDHTSKAAYKGSALGKDLSANEFHKMFSAEPETILQPFTEPTVQIPYSDDATSGDYDEDENMAQQQMQRKNRGRRK